METPRLTAPTMAVLNVLLAAEEDAPLWGLAICELTDLGSGTVYPILARLAKIGWATGRDETEPHSSRPARTYWQINPEARAQAEQELEARRSRRARARGIRMVRIEQAER